MKPTILALEGVTKQFHGTAAISDIDFDLQLGEIHALLGENGAGKSTLTKILCGVHRPTAGRLTIDGVETVLNSPADGLKRGIAMVFQETNLVPSMTVAQNIYLGDEKYFNRLRGLYIRAQQFLQSLNFHVDPMALVNSLGAAQKQLVEIARAVHHKARVIIFDEPTATLTPEEKHYFFELVRRLSKGGTSIIFISHALEEALQISDRITVLRDGKRVVTADKRALDRDAIVEAMVGRSLSGELYGRDSSRRLRQPGKKVLSIQNLSMGAMVRNSSMSVNAGQITAMFGLIGAGRSEMMKVVSGGLKRDLFHGGEVRLLGRTVRYRIPRTAMLDGIVYITEDRKHDGLLENMSIAENIYLGDLVGGSNPLKWLSRARAKSVTDHWISKLHIRTISSAARVIELSGGNQQKVVIAKALAQNPKIVIFDEPTRGIDVGAIAEIHNFIKNLADSGVAVVVISSYLPEVMSLADRILVVRRGRVVEEFNPLTSTEKDLMYAAVH